jgi:hypothetical protein
VLTAPPQSAWYSITDSEDWQIAMATATVRSSPVADGARCLATDCEWFEATGMSRLSKPE